MDGAIIAPTSPFPPPPPPPPLLPSTIIMKAMQCGADRAAATAAAAAAAPENQAAAAAAETETKIFFFSPSNQRCRSRRTCLSLSLVCLPGSKFRFQFLFWGDGSTFISRFPFQICISGRPERKKEAPLFSSSLLFFDSLHGEGGGRGEEAEMADPAAAAAAAAAFLPWREEEAFAAVV